MQHQKSDEFLFIFPHTFPIIQETLVPGDIRILRQMLFIKYFRLRYIYNHNRRLLKIKFTGVYCSFLSTVNINVSQFVSLRTSDSLGCAVKTRYQVPSCTRGNERIGDIPILEYLPIYIFFFWRHLDILKIEGERNSVL